MIIAVDGPAASGKGTLARRLAAHFGFAHLDSGALYRAVAAKLLRQGHDPRDATAATRAAETLTPSDIAASDLRTAAAGEGASVVAAVPAVRAALLDYQRHFAQQQPDAVIDGRDIGTVVCPNAEVKFYVDADVAERARRRHAELIAGGERLDYDKVLADMKTRDIRDATRAASPMKPAPGAHLLDTTDLSIDDAFERAVALVAAARLLFRAQT
jgi:cytidylate kinase